MYMYMYMYMFSLFYDELALFMTVLTSVYHVADRFT